MRKVFAVIVMVVAITVPFIAFDVLPVIGDPESAPNSHVTDYYIEHTIEECNSPNMVTSIIVDYRAFDTMFETTVMFLAGVCVVMILSGRSKKDGIVEIKTDEARNGHRPVFQSINKDVVISIIEPIILIYAIYVLFHGEVSLGGGFQAGALIGMTYLLDVMTTNHRIHIFTMGKYRSVAFAGLGPFIYALCGIIAMIGGGLFLEYKKLPIPIEEAELHSVGILMVEIGVTVGVMCTIITILNVLMERVRFDDDCD